VTADLTEAASEPRWKTFGLHAESPMLKLKHLRHPLWTAGVAKDVIAAYWNMKKLASRGERRFKNDARFNLQHVRNGFANRIDGAGDDTALLERICTAYIKATEQQSFCKPAYQATNWWKSVRKASLGPVRRALASRDIKALRAMYQNFFRDSCSAGLVGVPFRMSQAYNGKTVNESYERYFLSDALHRIDYWKSQTGNHFELRDLAAPAVGNPFGVQVDGHLVRTGTEYQHYCAHRISSLLSADSAFVVEIGGGFGSMAYYLLRDRPGLKYVDFDVPESLALAAYYLLKAFPQLSFLLYGEEELTQKSQGKFDVILMPTFELARLSANSADLVFSSHAMSNLSSHAVNEYLDQITRVNRGFFLYVGDGAAGGSLQTLIGRKYAALGLAEKRALEWNSMKFVHANEVELLYQMSVR
jgi:putative sugar O-methyltransferase